MCLSNPSTCIELAKVAVDQFCRTLATRAGVSPDGFPEVSGER